MGAWRVGERGVPTCSKIWKGVGSRGRVGEETWEVRKRGRGARVRRKWGGRKWGGRKEGRPTDGGRGLVEADKRGGPTWAEASLGDASLCQAN